jgi:hypothetical protein
MVAGKEICFCLLQGCISFSVMLFMVITDNKLIVFESQYAARYFV